MKPSSKIIFAIALSLLLPSCSGPSQGSSSETSTDTSISSSEEEKKGVLVAVDGARIDESAMTVYMFVEKDVASVSLSQLVHVSSHTVWKLYRGEKEIPTKIAAAENGKLADGDNQFFIVASSDDGLIERTYSLTIYRSFMVDISYYHDYQLLLTQRTATGHDYEIVDHFDIKGYAYKKIVDAEEKVVAGTLVPWANMNLYVVTTARSYTVTLDPSGGQVDTSSLTYAFDSSYRLPTPSRTGYRFLGWYDGANLFPQSGIWKEDMNKSLKARWEAIEYTIIYDTKGGVLDPDSPTSYTVEDDDIVLLNPSKQGYKSNGWVDSSSQKVDVIPHGSTGDIVLTATYETVVYSITYLIDEEADNPNPDTYTVEDQGIVLKDIAKEGYGFYGWMDESGKVVKTIDTSSGGDITLKPCWGTPGLQITANGVLEKGADCQSVTIPVNVTSIGKEAFSGCSSLTSVSIPEGVTSIGERAFYECASLASVTIPEGVTLIGDEAFCACDSLTSVVIPEGVTSINKGAFSRCTSLASVVLPEGVTSIGNFAFDGCTSLASVVLPEGVTSIGSFAFNGCSSLVSITIPEGVTYIGEWVFHSCSSLVSITIPKGVTSIRNAAFADCSSLTSVSIPEGVTSIGNSAFSYCSSLSSVTIPDGVTHIGERAFKDCSSLISVILPSSIKQIKSDAFLGSSLQYVFFKGRPDQRSSWTIYLSKYAESAVQPYYYSEKEPAQEGRYWHYVNGVPTVW